MAAKVDWGKYIITSSALALFVPAGLAAKQSMVVIFLILVVAIGVRTFATEPRLLLPSKIVAGLFITLLFYAALTHYFIISCHPCGYTALLKLPMLGLVVWIASTKMVIVDTAQSQKIPLVLGISLFVAVLFLAIEVLNDATIYRHMTGRLDDASVVISRYNRGTSALVILVWPISAWLIDHGHRVSAFLLTFTICVVVVFGDSGSALVSMLLACSTAALALLWPLLSFWIIAAGVALFTLFAPILFLFLLHWLQPISDLIPPSTLDRLEIWHHSASAVLQAPVFGYGIGVSRYLAIPAELGVNYKYFVVPTTHPHNAAIQIWLELGAIGLVLMMLLIWFIARPITKLNGYNRIAALASSTAIIFTGLVSYGFWQETWLSIIGVTIICFKFLGQSSKNTVGKD
ncbi:MAG: hypothetical protein CMM58_07385 [Rhodospirillaceae bacterium]|nr:hypothetical protein [Rhodospirillaceae bacterium]|tara:strand:- start:456 stop:1664 length:1209 start_codon:yes stop_codon:yes gene_type:complete